MVHKVATRIRIWKVKIKKCGYDLTDLHFKCKLYRKNGSHNSRSKTLIIIILLMSVIFLVRWVHFIKKCDTCFNNTLQFLFCVPYQDQIPVEDGPLSPQSISPDALQFTTWVPVGHQPSHWVLFWGNFRWDIDIVSGQGGCLKMLSLSQTAQFYCTVIMFIIMFCRKMEIPTWYFPWLN